MHEIYRNFFSGMVHHGSDDLFWGHGKKSFEHENSGPNSCWNWDVQKVLSRKCCDQVNIFIASSKDRQAQMRMIECFVREANLSHGICSRELRAFDDGNGSIESLERCARKEFSLAIRNLIQTSEAVGECRPI